MRHGHQLGRTITAAMAIASTFADAADVGGIVTSRHASQEHVLGQRQPSRRRGRRGAGSERQSHGRPGKSKAGLARCPARDERGDSSSCECGGRGGDGGGHAQVGIVQATLAHAP